MSSPIRNLPIKSAFVPALPKEKSLKPSGADPVVAQPAPKSGSPLSSAEAQRLGIQSNPNLFRTAMFRPGSDDSPLSFKIGTMSINEALGRADEYGPQLAHAAAYTVLAKNGLLE